MHFDSCNQLLHTEWFGNKIICTYSNSFNNIFFKVFSSYKNYGCLNLTSDTTTNINEQLSLRILDPVCCTVSTPRYPFAAVEVSAPAGFEDAFWPCG